MAVILFVHHQCHNAENFMPYVYTFRYQWLSISFICLYNTIMYDILIVTRRGGTARMECLILIYIFEIAICKAYVNEILIYENLNEKQLKHINLIPC